MEAKSRNSVKLPKAPSRQLKRFNYTNLLRLFLLIFAMIFLSRLSFGQGVGISESTIIPDASAILELKSSQRGFLVPRMTSDERTLIVNPAKGLLVYETNSKLFWYWDDDWITLTSSQVLTLLQQELDNTQTGAGLNADGDYISHTGTNYLNASTSFFNADSLLDKQVKFNLDSITSVASVGSDIQSELDNTQSGAGLAANGGYVVNGSTNYLGTSTSLAVADSLLDYRINFNLDSITSVASVGSDIQSELDNTQSGAGLAANGGYVVNGSTNYLGTSTSLAVADSLLDYRINFNLDSITSVASVGSDIQSELDNTQSGAGLAANGGYVVNGSTNYLGTSTSLAVADSLLDYRINFNLDSITSVASVGSDIQSELDNTQSGAGLAANGGYVVNGSTNYLGTSTSLAVADSLLDYRINFNLDSITSVASVGSDIQSELDNTQSGAGLAANGGYVVNGSTNYLGTSTSLAVADSLLDYRINFNLDSITSVASVGSDIQSELDNTQSGAGLAANGGYVVNGSTNYLGTSTSLAIADSLLDYRINFNLDSITSVASVGSDIQSELDNTQSGAGLAANGGYVVNGSTNYLGTSTSLAVADSLLDYRINFNLDSITSVASVGSDIQSELDNTQSGAGLAANGGYVVNGSTNYLGTSTSLAVADSLLDYRINFNLDSITSVASVGSDIQSELDNTQSGAGLAANGGYVVNGSTNYLGTSTSLAVADSLLDYRINFNLDSITSVASVGSDIQSELDNTQSGAGLAANGGYVVNGSTNYLGTSTSLAVADSLLDYRINFNLDSITSVASVGSDIQSELDNTQSGAGLAANGGYVVNGSTNYLGTSTSLAVADSLLDYRINFNLDSITSVASVGSDIQSELDTGLAANGGYVVNGSTNYLGTSTSLAVADSLLDYRINFNLDSITSVASVGSDIQSELDNTQSGAGLAANGGYVVNGSTNYLGTSTSLAVADSLLDYRINFNLDSITSVASVGSDIQSELDNTQSGAGLAANGGYVVNGSTNYLGTSTSLAVADSLLDYRINFNLDSITSVASVGSDIQSELDNTQSGAGLAANGGYVVNGSTNYLGTSTSLAVADSLLDYRINFNLDSITSVASVGSDIQSELDNTQSGAGLAANGGYVVNGSTNYLGTSTSLAVADSLLDYRINFNLDSITSVASVGSDIQSELDNTQSGAGLAANGGYVVNGSTNYLGTSTSLAVADSLLDYRINFNLDSITSVASVGSDIQSELDNTQSGAGLAANGGYVVNGSTNYLGTSTSLAVADSLLDYRINFNLDSITSVASVGSDIQSELDNTQSGAGLAANGGYVVNGSTNYLGTSTSLAVADSLLDYRINFNLDSITSVASVGSDIQSELDNTQSGAGLAANGGYVVNGSTNYLGTSTSLAVADSLLDYRINFNLDSITSVASVGSDIQSELDNTQSGAGLAANGGYVVNGSTNYLGTSTSLAVADSLLDYRINFNLDSITSVASVGSDIQSELDNTQSGAGLAANGGYVVNGSTNYLGTSTSLAVADSLLDYRINFNLDSITSVASVGSDIQSELDNTQSGAGLAANGGYVVNGSTNYLGTSTSLAVADSLLDYRINFNLDSITSVASVGSDIQSELDNTQSGAGLAANGGYVVNGSTNYLGTSTSLAVADSLLDYRINFNLDSITSVASVGSDIQSELDNTQSGAGLAANGGYVVNGSTNYLGTSTSLAVADSLLDYRINFNLDSITSVASVGSDIQSELDNTQSGAGLAANGGYVVNGSTNYLGTSTSLAVADSLLDYRINFNLDSITSVASVGSDIQSELDNTQSGAGLAANGGYVVNGSTNYLGTSTSLAVADSLLDYRINFNLDSITSVATSSANAYLENDQISNSIVGVTVSDLQFDIKAGEVWSFEFNLQNGGDGSGVLYWAVEIPSGNLRAVVKGMGSSPNIMESDVITASGSFTSNGFNEGSLQEGWTQITGVVAGGATGGTVSLKFKNSVSGHTTTIYQYSYLTARRIN
jgi:hypothetical protein